jgi:transcriptional regulator with XRE-family HTH domain
MLITMSTFGERVKKARIALGISQLQFGNRVGLSQQNIAKIENNPNVKGSNHIAEIADALNVSIDYLRTGVESSKKTLIKLHISNWNNEKNIIETKNIILKNDFIYLKIQDDSMFNRQDSPTFPEGTIITVDPNKPIENKNFIVAKHKVNNKNFFRQYIDDGVEKNLRPLNSQYRIYDANDFTILGVVIASMNLDL